MNLTIYTSYRDAERDADEYAGTTGITHLVVERFPAGPVIDIDLECLLPDDMLKAEHRYTVLSEAEWEQVKDEWNAEVQYEANGYERLCEISGEDVEQQWFGDLDPEIRKDAR